MRVCPAAFFASLKKMPRAIAIAVDWLAKRAESLALNPLGRRRFAQPTRSLPPLNKDMQLPKHKMAKVAAKKAQSRSPKHQKKERKEEAAAAANDMDACDAQPTEAAPASNEAAEPVVSRLPTKLKTKEEKAAIRRQRLVANKSKNLYKKRSGGVTAKNGPRAINQVSIISL